MTEFRSQAPCVWNPTQVFNPETEMFFTDAAAWDLIARLLDENYPFCPIVLRKPAGELAYETEVVLGSGLPKLYIKIQVKSGVIWGRSFHNSTR